jgi:hypothetical protein
MTVLIDPPRGRVMSTQPPPPSSVSANLLGLTCEDSRSNVSEDSQSLNSADT